MRRGDFRNPLPMPRALCMATDRCLAPTLRARAPTAGLHATPRHMYGACTCKHAHRHLAVRCGASRLVRRQMCGRVDATEMCAGVCMDKTTGMRIDMHMDMCIDMCVDMRIDMCIDMCIDMRIDICTDMCIDM